MSTTYLLSKDIEVLNQSQKLCEDLEVYDLIAKLQLFNKNLQVSIVNFKSAPTVIEFIESLKFKSFVDFHYLLSSYIQQCNDVEIVFQLLEYAENFKYLPNKQKFFECIVDHATYSGKFEIAKYILSLSFLDKQDLLKVCVRSLCDFFRHYEVQIQCREYPDSDSRLLEVKDDFYQLLIDFKYSFTKEESEILDNWFGEED